jgi:hypothetical protein
MSFTIPVHWKETQSYEIDLTRGGGSERVGHCVTFCENEQLNISNKELLGV